ncbi:MAG: right-handed parallel beta-helix repeat-containing protein [Chitinophagales bacterium]|nr:right-handed parallel beta-helix repeat-containing protein [Chitinophagales bacterium]MDW8394485.1 right-handed parallel beta-helix repeat-containing protein [Chitinophagales bacterium]
MPSQVASLVSDGDTVSIDAGVYPGDVAYWGKNNLLLRGVGGMAHLKSGGLSYGNKAIWVIGGNQVTVEYIEFSECTSTDKNGGGIRAEGKNLTVRHCYFHHNETGILAGSVNPSTIVIEYSEFGYNGHANGYAHNCYINHIDTLIFRYNYVHDGVVGHELKSRARVNYIMYNRFSNESGNASRELDLPNGGPCLLIGNIIQQGIYATNSGIIGYGLEGLSNPPPHDLYLINNTVVNEKSTGTFLHIGNSTNLLKLTNNLFAGSGTFLNGTAALLDSTTNWRVNSPAAAGFVDAGNLDFHLTAVSDAIDAGTFPGTTSSGFDLTPMEEYLHPAGKITRITNGPLDIGAFEYVWPQQAGDLQEILPVCDLLQTGCSFQVCCASVAVIRIRDVFGRIVGELPAGTGCRAINFSHRASGWFFAEMTYPTGRKEIRRMVAVCT